MAKRKVSFEIPDDLATYLGSAEELATAAKEAFVLQLLRDARISQGKAAALLGLTRWDMIDLAAHHRIASAPLTPEEAEQEVAAARRDARDKLAG